jgi:hypothetical protein
MENLYSPFKPVSDTETEVVLELNSLSRKFQAFNYKIFPIFFVFAGIVSMSIMNHGEERIIGLLLGISLFATALLYAFIKYIIRLQVNKWGITVEKTSLIQPNITQHIDKRDIRKITMKIFTGRGGGVSYYVETVQLKKVKILFIPLIEIDRKNAPIIGQKFAGILGVDFEDQNKS